MVPKVIPTVANKDKASAVVTNATSLPGTTTIVVTAEDGFTTKHIKLILRFKNQVAMVIHGRQILSCNN